MTSSIKSQKTKLSALFNLEFYKKQNGWKLGSSRKAKKPPQKSDEIRQNRDVIHTSKEGKQSDPLNTAFVDTKSDTSQDYQQSRDPSSIKSNSKCVTQLGTPKINISKILQELQKTNLDFKEQTNTEEFLEDFPESVDEDSVWVSHTDAIDGLHYPEDVISPEDWEHGLFGDIPWNEAESANRPQEADDKSVDSEGELMRGVHAAPHSSETELELPPELTTSDVSSSSLCRLSGSQLLQAVQKHSLLLRKLLQEGEHRQKIIIATPPISPSSSIEDFLIWEVARKSHHRGRGGDTVVVIHYAWVLYSIKKGLLPVPIDLVELEGVGSD